MAEAIPDEVEAKLLAPRPTTLTAIARLRELAGYTLRPLATQRLHTVYLDCAGLVLTRNGLALRARQHGRHWEMTVKWQGEVDGDVHRRPELTVPLVARPQGSFTIDDPEVRRHLAGYLAGRPLQVVLISDIVRRRLALVAPDAADDAPPLAEIALDRVHLHRDKNEAEERYCEVEIEAIRGNVDDVRAASAALREALQLQPSTLTKFARGMQMLHGVGALAVDDTELGPADSIASAARKVTAAALVCLRRADPPCRSGEDPEAVHDMRVVIRRLRAAMKTLAPGFAPRWSATTRAELKWLAQQLGTVRDLDVHVQRVLAFADVAPPSLRASVMDLVQRGEATRPACQRAVAAVFESLRYQKLLLRLEDFATGHRGAPAASTGRQPAGEIAAQAIHRAYRRVRRCGKGLGQRPRPEALHELRIRAKRARYALELYVGLVGKPARRAAKRLAAMQEHLGTYNDAVVGADFVQAYVTERGSALTPPTMLGLGALIGAEMSTAQALRAEFPRRWRRLTGKRMRRDVDMVVAVLTGEKSESLQPASGVGQREEA